MTPEEKNAQLVARYKAFLKRRAEEHAKDDADPERQKRVADAMEELRKRNEERGTSIVAVPDIIRQK